MIRKTLALLLAFVLVCAAASASAEAAPLKTIVFCLEWTYMPRRRWDITGKPGWT